MRYFAIIFAAAASALSCQATSVPTQDVASLIKARQAVVKRDTDGLSIVKKRAADWHGQVSGLHSDLSPLCSSIHQQCQSIRTCSGPQRSHYGSAIYDNISQCKHLIASCGSRPPHRYPKPSQWPHNPNPTCSTLASLTVELVTELIATVAEIEAITYLLTEVQCGSLNSTLEELDFELALLLEGIDVAITLEQYCNFTGTCRSYINPYLSTVTPSVSARFSRTVATLHTS